MRHVFIGMACIIAWNCRDIQPFATSAPVQGYQIDGTVSTANGVPLDSVEVIVDYYSFSQVTPIDTQRVVLTDSTQFVDISVYTPANVYVRRLFGGFRSAGVVPRARWDGVDNEGKPVPSGKYLIRYTVGSSIAKQSPVIIGGHTTAMTDAEGHFTITNDHLPIGEEFDTYDTDGFYQETIEIQPEVLLEFRKLALVQAYIVQVTKDQTTTGVFTLQ